MDQNEKEMIIEAFEDVKYSIWVLITGMEKLVSTMWSTIAIDGPGFGCPDLSEALDNMEKTIEKLSKSL